MNPEIRQEAGKENEIRNLLWIHSRRFGGGQTNVRKQGQRPRTQGWHWDLQVIFGFVHERKRKPQCSGFILL
jgi:hypothetical protein